MHSLAFNPFHYLVSQTQLVATVVGAGRVSMQKEAVATAGPQLLVKGRGSGKAAAALTRDISLMSWGVRPLESDRRLPAEMPASSGLEPGAVIPSDLL